MAVPEGGRAPSALLSCQQGPSSSACLQFFPTQLTKQHGTQGTGWRHVSPANRGGCAQAPAATGSRAFPHSCQRSKAGNRPPRRAFALAKGSVAVEHCAQLCRASAKAAVAGTCQATIISLHSQALAHTPSQLRQACPKAAWLKRWQGLAGRWCCVMHRPALSA